MICAVLPWTSPTRRSSWASASVRIRGDAACATIRFALAAAHDFLRRLGLRHARLRDALLGRPSIATRRGELRHAASRARSSSSIALPSSAGDFTVVHAGRFQRR